MRRREFLGVLGVAAVWPRAINAQQRERLPRVGVLMILSETDPDAQPRVKAFEQGLQQVGWGKEKVYLDYRWAHGDFSRIQSFASEIVKLVPNVIVANSTPVLKVFHKQTSTIPIVFVQVLDPVGQGFVKSLSQPGGNITGFSNFEFPMGTKWVELLKEIAPSTKSTAVIFNPETAPFVEAFFREIKATASAFGIEAATITVSDITGLESAMAAASARPDASVIVLPDAFTSAHRAIIIELVDRNHLVGIYPFRYFATDGGLVAYGSEIDDMFRRTGEYVGRILDGTSPGDLPIQAPVKWELVINLKAAKALGLSVPPRLLARADEVIE
jgi:putative tryptophan/tyrosine transport system substrate-binding protein